MSKDIKEKVKRELKEIDEKINQELDEIEEKSVIDEELLRLINDLHERADNLKKDFEYIERELKKRNIK